MRNLFYLNLLIILIGCGVNNLPEIAKESYELSDIEGPTVVAVFPRPESKNVSLDTIISIKFSEPVLSESVNELSFYVQSKAGKISGTYIFSDDTRSVYFVPEELLEPQTQYSITINNRISDTAGNELVDQDPNDKLVATPFVSVFTTADEEPDIQ